MADCKFLIDIGLGLQLVIEHAGPASDVRIERISRDCFRDGGALAEVIAFYKSKGEDYAADSVEDEKVDPGLEVLFLFTSPIYFTVAVLYKTPFLNSVNLNALYERTSYQSSELLVRYLYLHIYLKICIECYVQAVMAMPDIVMQSLALALRYLRQFGMEKVLKLGASFRRFAGHSEMSLSPNALRQLEVLASATDESMTFMLV